MDVSFCAFFFPFICNSAAERPYFVQSLHHLTFIVQSGLVLPVWSWRPRLLAYNQLLDGTDLTVNLGLDVVERVDEHFVAAGGCAARILGRIGVIFFFAVAVVQKLIQLQVERFHSSIRGVLQFLVGSKINGVKFVE